MGSETILNQAIQNIFNKHDQVLSSHPNFRQKDKKLPKQQLELALAVLLVDLAACDQQFDAQEYQVIAMGLRRVFGTQKGEIASLVHQAQASLAQLRGVSNFAALLRENLNEEEKRVIMEVIDEIIEADGVEDGFETYLRHKFSELLEIPVEPKKVKPAKVA